MEKMETTEYYAYKKKKKILLLINIGIPIITLISLFFIVIIELNDNFTLVHLRELKDSLKKLPIISTEAKMEITLSSLKTIEGCFCESQEKWYQRKCFDSQEDCTNIKESNEIFFTSFRNKKVALSSPLFINYIEYANNLNISVNGKCLDEKQFKHGIIDTRGEYLCLSDRQNSNNPFNTLVVSDIPDFTYPGKIDFSEDDGEKHFWYFNKSIIEDKITEDNNNEIVLSSFILSKGPPCVDPEETVTPFKMFPLQSGFFEKKNGCKKKVLSSSFDPRYKKVDTTNISDIFDTNVAEELELKEMIGKFNIELLKGSVDLYRRQYLGIDFVKAKALNFDPKVLVEEEYYSSIENYYYSIKLGMFNFLAFSLVIIFCAIFLISSSTTNKCSQMLRIMILILWGLILMSLIISLVAILKINIICGIFDNIINETQRINYNAVLTREIACIILIIISVLQIVLTIISGWFYKEQVKLDMLLFKSRENTEYYK